LMIRHSKKAMDAPRRKNKEERIARNNNSWVGQEIPGQRQLQFNRSWAKIPQLHGADKKERRRESGD